MRKLVLFAMGVVLAIASLCAENATFKTRYCPVFIRTLRFAG